MPKLPEINDYPSWTRLTSNGEVVHIRPVREADVSGLRHYFLGLSTSSRYRRFMGALSELSAAEIARLLGNGRVATFSVIAEVTSGDGPSIVGEANCALDLECRRGELAVSVRDRWQRHGIGLALLDVMECCATRAGLQHLFGETLQSNEEMKALARRAGFAVTRRPGDWQVVHLEKRLSSGERCQG